MIASGRMPTTVGGIMSPVISVRERRAGQRRHAPDDRKKGVNAVMVQPDASGQWGIATDRDVLQKVISANRSPARTQVSEIATRPLVTVKREMSLSDASQRHGRANVRRVVVEMDGKPVGMVTDNDLFRTVEVFGWGEV